MPCVEPAGADGSTPMTMVCEQHESAEIEKVTVFPETVPATPAAWSTDIVGRTDGLFVTVALAGERVTVIDTLNEVVPLQLNIIDPISSAVP